MTQPSKILYLATQSEWGGAQRYIFDLATNLPADQYEICIAAGGGQELFTKVDEKNIKYYNLKNLVREINPLKDLKAYLEIKKLLQDVKPDILHLNSSKAGVIGAIAGKHADIKKIIYTAHGFVFNEPMPNWKKLIYKIVERYSAKYKDKIICVSEFDKQAGIENKIADENKFVTIHNRIGRFNLLEKQFAKNSLGLAEKTVVGTVANFYPTKGLIYLIQAAKIVRQKFPDAIFAVIGDGQERHQLETEIKKLNLQNNFLLLGAKKNAGQYLPAFDIYICSSVKEGFPYSILEAMSAGLPIISTNAGGIPEMIEDEKPRLRFAVARQAGLLVEPADGEALANGIIKLIENKELADELGRQAKNKVIDKFNIEKMVEETEKSYKDF